AQARASPSQFLRPCLSPPAPTTEPSSSPPAQPSAHPALPSRSTTAPTSPSGASRSTSARLRNSASRVGVGRLHDHQAGAPHRRPRRYDSGLGVPIDGRICERRQDRVGRPPAKASERGGGG